ncbi:hypothetical protein BVC80_1835g741 [Macleaya cordata]|uniref:Uncharacterized protein n=1 Tax=Macleaya cordata TaxID=56857 RepID=A0A200R6H9_MACCD|nr:hypothetical protein BVC80_1835g741 [Macleaya cordata]
MSERQKASRHQRKASQSMFILPENLTSSDFDVPLVDINNGGGTKRSSESKPVQPPPLQVNNIINVPLPPPSNSASSTKVLFQENVDQKSIDNNAGLVD